MKTLKSLLILLLTSAVVTIGIVAIILIPHTWGAYTLITYLLGFLVLLPAADFWEKYFNEKISFFRRWW